MNYIRRNILFVSWLVLMFTVLLMAVVSSFSDVMPYFAIAILVLSAIKFTIVALQFMEMRLAHPFWRIALLVYVGLFIGSIFLMILL